MVKTRRNTFMMWLLPSALWLMAGCSVIDDDLSNCPTDEAQYQMEYELKLVTNMTTELQTQLTTITVTHGDRPPVRRLYDHRQFLV